MRGARTLARQVDGAHRVSGEVHRYRRQPHDAAIAGGTRLVGTRAGFAIEFEAAQRRRHGVADVETTAGDAHVALVAPAQIAAHLISGIEAVACEQALRQAEGHGGVVGPLPRREAKGAATDHVRQRGETPGRLELQRRAQRIADGETEQTAAVAVLIKHDGILSWNKRRAHPCPAIDDQPAETVTAATSAC